MSTPIVLLIIAIAVYGSAWITNRIRSNWLKQRVVSRPLQSFLTVRTECHSLPRYVRTPLADLVERTLDQRIHA